MNFKQQLQERTAEAEKIITSFLPEEKGYQKTVIEAMNYSILSGGKRLRPIFMMETYKLFGGSENVIEPFMASIEMIHTYSLIHDDLPAMDDDEYRRGRKTTHIVYGEDMAILAGDALLNLAFETATMAFSRIENDLEMYKRVAKAMSVLGTKAGIHGMVGGQTADVESENLAESITREKLLYIHENKTAALIQSAMMIGAILAGADDEKIALVEKCAYNIGVAFQIQDDILDIIGTQEELGKPIGSDEKNHKQTYVSLNGLEKSGEEVEHLSKEALSLLNDCRQEKSGDFLEQLIFDLIHRTK